MTVIIAVISLIVLVLIAIKLATFLWKLLKFALFGLKWISPLTWPMIAFIAGNTIGFIASIFVAVGLYILYIKLAMKRKQKEAELAS